MIESKVRAFAQILIDLNIPKETTCGIVSLLGSQENLDAMVDYIKCHETASETELLKKAQEICKL